MKSWIPAAVLVCWLTACGHGPAPAPPSASAPPPPTAAPAPPAPAETARPPATATPTAAAATDALSKAAALQAAGNLAEARAVLQPLAASDDAPAKVLDLLGAIDLAILLSPAPAPEKVDYTIVAGDSLGKIAKRYRTTIALLKQANHLTTDLVRIGDRLRIYQAEFAVTVSKTANTLTVTDHGHFFKRYRVGTGEYSKTPTGEFKITTRLKDPPWWKDGQSIPFGDPQNILGTHWLGLDVPGYGLHGTWETNSIGKQATAGCIRLLNDDIAELYTILPVGTPVTIQE